MTVNPLKVFLITLWSPDLEAAANFYRLALGLAELPHPTGHPHFQLGEAILAIQSGQPRPAENAHPGDFPLLAITVPDLDQAVRRLDQHGVELPFGIESGPSQRWVRICDPAGNLVELVEQVQAGDPHKPLSSFYAEYWQKTSQLVEQFKQLLSGLPVQALDWSPAPQVNSLAVLAVHTAGAYRYWLLDVIAGITSGRDREAEFSTSSLEVPAIQQRLDQILDLISQVVHPLELEDLNSIRMSQRDGKEYTVGRVLLHVYEHAALHLGHAQLTRQLWEASTNVT